MPHICLKMTSAVPAAKVETTEIFAHIHEAIVNTIENATLSSCKSWVEQIEQPYRGDGSDLNPPFIVLSIALFSGRPESQRKALAEQCFAYLRPLYSSAVAIFVEVRELNRETCVNG